MRKLNLDNSGVLEDGQPKALVAEARKRRDDFADGRWDYIGGFFVDFMRQRKCDGILPPFSHHNRVFVDRLTKERIFSTQPYVTDRDVLALFGQEERDLICR